MWFAGRRHSGVGPQGPFFCIHGREGPCPHGGAIVVHEPVSHSRVIRVSNLLHSAFRRNNKMARHTRAAIPVATPQPSPYKAVAPATPAPLAGAAGTLLPSVQTFDVVPFRGRELGAGQQVRAALPRAQQRLAPPPPAHGGVIA